MKYQRLLHILTSMAAMRGSGGRFAKVDNYEQPRYEVQNQMWQAPERKSWVEKVSPVLMVLVIVMSFALGSLWSKVTYLEKAALTPTTTANQQAGTGTQQQQAEPAKADLETIKALFSKNVIKFGDANKKVLFVEVADPSCPYCHAAAGKNSELSRQMGTQFVLKADGGTYLAPVEEMKKLVDAGKASMVQLYSPGHGNGELGMKALYCAHEKGKFWQVHDKLYSMEGYNMLNDTVKNDVANAGTLAEFLKSEIDSSFLKSCLESGKYDTRISEDTDLARSIGVGGTPGFYVNDKFFGGAYSYADMKATVDAVL